MHEAKSTSKWGALIPPHARVRIPFPHPVAMPSLCNFDAVILATSPTTTTPGKLLPLPEYDIHLRPSTHLTTLAPHPSEPPAAGDDMSTGDSTIKTVTKAETSTCTCYIPSTPNQHFRVMVTNKSPSDACVSVSVDGEWVYSGLSYPPLHRAIYFSGRVVDQHTIQEMRFTEVDVTCTNPPLD